MGVWGTWHNCVDRVSAPRMRPIVLGRTCAVSPYRATLRAVRLVGPGYTPCMLGPHRYRGTLVLCAVALLCLSTGVGPRSVGGAEGYPLSPHGRVGVYLTSYAACDSDTLAGLYGARARGELNAVVVNVKNMHGEITYASSVAAALRVGAVVARLDLRSFVRALHARGIYVIARQVLFYDPKLAAALGCEGDWVDPALPEVIDYNLRVAEEVAGYGVDELQFDYVRYPDDKAIGVVFEERRRAVTAFVEQAARLLSGRVHLSVDVFGRVLWPWNARGIDPIGQVLEDLAAVSDTVSPMVYPSHYSEPKYTQDPYRAVFDGLASGTQRTSTPLRPFLQVFDRGVPEHMPLRDYISAQIRAAQDSDADGYLFWHPACDYEELYQVLGSVARP